jgi:dCTP diphosphatase
MLTRAQVEEERADVLLYLIRLADKLDVDLVEATKGKLEANGVRYPVEKAWVSTDIQSGPAIGVQH